MARNQPAPSTRLRWTDLRNQVLAAASIPPDERWVWLEQEVREKIETRPNDLCVRDHGGDVHSLAILPEEPVRRWLVATLATDDPPAAGRMRNVDNRVESAAPGGFGALSLAGPVAVTAAVLRLVDAGRRPRRAGVLLLAGSDRTRLEELAAEWVGADGDAIVFELPSRPGTLESGMAVTEFPGPAERLNHVQEDLRRTVRALALTPVPVSPPGDGLAATLRRRSVPALAVGAGALDPGSASERLLWDDLALVSRLAEGLLDGGAGGAG